MKKLVTVEECSAFLFNNTDNNIEYKYTFDDSFDCLGKIIEKFQLTSVEDVRILFCILTEVIEDIYEPTVLYDKNYTFAGNVIPYRCDAEARYFLEKYQEEGTYADSEIYKKILEEPLGSPLYDELDGWFMICRDYILEHPDFK